MFSHETWKRVDVPWSRRVGTVSRCGRARSHPLPLRSPTLLKCVASRTRFLYRAASALHAYVRERLHACALYLKHNDHDRASLTIPSKFLGVCTYTINSIICVIERYVSCVERDLPDKLLCNKKNLLKKSIYVLRIADFKDLCLFCEMLLKKSFFIHIENIETVIQNRFWICTWMDYLGTRCLEIR